MLENLGLVAAFLCVLIGGFLIYNSTSSDETTWLMGGAVVLAIGAIGCLSLEKSSNGGKKSGGTTIPNSEQAISFKQLPQEQPTRADIEEYLANHVRGAEH